MSPSSSRPETHAAEALADALAARGVSADVHDGYGLALVSVWAGLVVWCHGGRYWWRSGWDARRYRVIYAWHPATEPARAAHRVARRYAQLRESHTLAAPVTGAPPCP
ncbi:hypothetical protein [Nonomuraea jiangxiensis]|uniref:hypothetical protein n=1 Tax=Nonomuraea jiangxiensis TaxID=633440 RepID=UPI00115FC16C|nr:hypothetical protein [Nonomuraea jiangxiensis]